MMRKISETINSKAAGIKKRAGEFYIRNRYVSGVTVIELVLIIVILIALLIIFKTQLTDLLNTIFDKITSQSSAI